MVTLEQDSELDLPPLPGHLAGRLMAEPGHKGFEQLDRHLVSLSKQGFIASNAMISGTDEEAVEKFSRFTAAVEQYITLAEELVYRPLAGKNRDKMSQKINQLVSEFTDVKTRLHRFVKLDVRAAKLHRRLTSNAICRIDKIIVQRYSLERELITPELIAG